jgi:hypothetical protein
MQLQKATIAELDDKNKPKNELPVQFNPTSLRLQVTNSIEGNKQVGRQVRQYIGSSSTTLTLDLIFDTADEGTTETPRSVREKTEMVERFLRPKSKEKKKFVAPRIRFHWNDLVFDGVVDSITIDLDHFAASGTPLRAKVSLAIKEQNRDLELLTAGPGANRGGNAPKPGHPSAGSPGSAGTGIATNTEPALDGESASEFASRVGVDPAAWRGLQLGGENSLALSAGVEVGFDASLSASAGLGVTLGVEAGASLSLEASFGLEASAALNAVAGVGTGAELAAGFALSAAGGVSAAIESVQSARNQSVQEESRAAFKAPAPALPVAVTQSGNSSVPGAAVSAEQRTSAQPKPPEQTRTPLHSTGLPTPSSPPGATPAPRPPRADPRSSGFGFGVPLRTTVGRAADLRAESIQGHVTVKPRPVSGAPPTTSDPTKPGWVALPARDRAREVADKLQGTLRPARPCGCSGRCRH